MVILRFDPVYSFRLSRIDYFASPAQVQRLSTFDPLLEPFVQPKGFKGKPMSTGKTAGTSPLKSFFYRPPWVGLIAFFIVLVFQALGHTIMIFMEEVWPGEHYIYESALRWAWPARPCCSMA